MGVCTYVMGAQAVGGLECRGLGGKYQMLKEGVNPNNKALVLSIYWLPG